MKIKKLLVVVLSGCTFVSHAETGFYQLNYQIERNEAAVSDCPKAMSGKVVVPETARSGGQDYQVTSIGCPVLYRGFCNCRGITEVSLPSSIKYINREAFQGCVRLKKINLPPTIKGIGYSAFEQCESLDSIKIPQGISEIEFKTFQGCKNLKYVSMPFTVKEINHEAFMDCASLTEIQIPSFVGFIGGNAFKNCKKLRNIILPSKLEKIGEGSFEGCDAITEIEIPSSVSYIGDDAFKNSKNLKHVVLKDCNFGGGKGLFKGCENLEFVDGYNLPFVASRMFQNCKKLKNISLGLNVTSIDPSAFAGTTIETFEVSKFVNNGLEYAQNYKGWISLKSIIVDPTNKNYTSVDGVLYNKDKTKLLRFPVGKETDEFVLPATVKEIADYAFAGCTGLKKLVLPKDFSAFSENSFSDCPYLNIEMK